ncbi:MAG: DUF5658 family protein [Steroidobacteraceae bacterium]
MSHDSPEPTLAAANRRQLHERRRRTWYSLLLGNFTPRRRDPRRHNEAHFAAVDWHDRRWLFVASAILLFSALDAVLTLTLLQFGATEANPVMALLIGGNDLRFALCKLGMTAGGVVTLTLIARLKAFGRLPVSLILYAVLGLYSVLILYEGWLLLHLRSAH